MAICHSLVSEHSAARVYLLIFSSPTLHIHVDYKYADYLSATRTGGLRVNTGRWENNVHLDRKDWLCLVCKSSQHVEDEHHFIFDCLLYSHIRARHASFFSKLRPCLTFLLGMNQMHVVFLLPGRSCFPHRSSICMNRTLSVDPQLVPRTLNIKRNETLHPLPGERSLCTACIEFSLHNAADVTLHLSTQLLKACQQCHTATLY